MSADTASQTPQDVLRDILPRLSDEELDRWLRGEVEDLFAAADRGAVTYVELTADCIVEITREKWRRVPSDPLSVFTRWVDDLEEEYERRPRADLADDLKRVRIRKALLQAPQRTNASIAHELGVGETTVRMARYAFEVKGRIPVYRGGEPGRVTSEPEPELPPLPEATVVVATDW